MDPDTLKWILQLIAKEKEIESAVSRIAEDAGVEAQFTEGESGDRGRGQYAFDSGKILFDQPASVYDQKMHGKYRISPWVYAHEAGHMLNDLYGFEDTPMSPEERATARRTHVEEANYPGSDEHLMYRYASEPGEEKASALASWLLGIHADPDAREPRMSPEGRSLPRNVHHPLAEPGERTLAETADSVTASERPKGVGGTIKVLGPRRGYDSVDIEPQRYVYADDRRSDVRGGMMDPENLEQLRRAWSKYVAMRESPEFPTNPFEIR